MLSNILTIGVSGLMGNCMYIKINYCLIDAFMNYFFFICIFYNGQSPERSVKPLSWPVII